MPEHDALISQYSHLNTFPRQDEALLSLRKIASLVKPIMRARNWTVGTLTEFYPDQGNLLGLNVNHGEKICLRLRYPGDKNQFLPLEQVVDTMLHELSHNEIGPHNAQFHALWDQLRKEYEGLVSKGYTGEGFLSDGHKLGGRRVPRDEARRIARAAAEKRRTLYAGSGQKLGGRPVAAGTDIRTVIVDAIERRNTVLTGCGSERTNEKEKRDLADAATKNGFRTKAEEDEANDRAIAQALWELVQEDEKEKYGDSYVPPTATNPTGNGGGKFGPGKAIKEDSPSNTPAAPPPIRAKAPPVRQHPDRPVSHPPSPEPDLDGWTCPVCTLHNPINFLACDACTSERPPEITKQIADADRKKVTATKPPGLAETWRCSRCSTIMEDKWWTCSTCGKLKDKS
ncbi:zinc ion binding protein-like protein [Hyaloscypha hepaticicola]|uniref:Zinc ion binding protein-like protein n=1 Tax=Hyaloscypha hepaticicola TaxID=2082293 RepID=A0A2J6Q418_9HELO|nr:zinc ion binding protein-like protein [Hyaloscypha hepaticicola]